MEAIQVKTATVGDSIYQTLKRQIMLLHYKPGQNLNINELEKKLQVSRSPVRDALIRLSNDGLVDIFPQKGTRVSLIDIKRVEEERFIRKSLEESAVRLFLENHRKSDIALLESIIEKQREVLSDENMIAFLDADNDFHGMFFSVIGKSRCWEMILNLTSNHHRMRVLTYSHKDIVNSIILQHEDILKKIKENNIDAVLKAEHEHLSKILNETNMLIEEHPDYFKHNLDL